MTRGEFAAFVTETGHTVPDEVGHSFRNPGFAQDDSHPVVCVNWHDARAYAEWLSGKTGKDYRLLSEAEWEYACRAGTLTPFWWGSSITPDQANYRVARPKPSNVVNLMDALRRSIAIETGGMEEPEEDAANLGDSKTNPEKTRKTLPVDSFEPNPWGLYQVHGNVWEWCEDCWNESYDGAPASGSVWAAGDRELRPIRGGSWRDEPWELRAAHRIADAADNRFDSVGFRLARTLTP